MTIKNKHSKFWTTLDTKETARETKLINLHSYRNAISNFISIIVPGQNIPVVFSGQDSYTDGKSVTLSADINNDEIDISCGLALHEASHIRDTDFTVVAGDPYADIDYTYPAPSYFRDVVREFINASNISDSNKKALLTNLSTTASILKDILNVVEDRRIDNNTFKLAPGYRGYYKALYDKYFNADIIAKRLSLPNQKETLSNYIFHFINVASVNRNLSALKGLKSIYKILDLKNIDRLENTEQSFELSKTIFLEILKFVAVQAERDDKKNKGKKGSKDGKNGKDGNDSNEKSILDDSFFPDKDPREPRTSSDSMSKMLRDLDNEQLDLPSDNYNGDLLTKEEKEELAKAITEISDFMNQDTKKTRLSDEDIMVIDAMDSAKTKMTDINNPFQDGDESFNESNIKVLVHNTLTKQFINSELSSLTSKIANYRDEVSEGMIKGTSLGKKLKVRSEQRPTTYVRQRGGKIQNRILAEAGAGNYQLFEKTYIDEYPDAITHISIDGSSSMRGSKFSDSIICAVALAKAADMVEGLDVVISFRGGGSANNKYPEILIAYDSRKDSLSKISNLFPYLACNGTTPEGLCFAAIQNMISKSTHDRNSYFVNLSDGMPMFYYPTKGGTSTYVDSVATKHTKEQIRQFKKKGIKVLSYLISAYTNGAPQKEFTEMYGVDGKCIDVTNIGQITKTMNELFLTK